MKFWFKEFLLVEDRLLWTRFILNIKVFEYISISNYLKLFSIIVELFYLNGLY